MRRPPSDGPGEMSHSAARGLNDELTVILNALDESLYALDDDDPLRELLQDAETAAKRCVLVSNGLMRYAQRASMRKEPRDFMSFLQD